MRKRLRRFIVRAAKRLGSESAYTEKPQEKILFSRRVLDDFRHNVGIYPAETGGMLGSRESGGRIDLCHFDSLSKNSPGSFYYDVESMSEVFRSWEKQGFITNGIYHSHPMGAVRPSFHDISTALLHIRFFGLDYFYLPIIQSHSRGFYTMYFYIVKLKGLRVSVHLNYVIKACEEGYRLLPYKPWQRSYSVEELDGYRVKNCAGEEKKTDDCFEKVRGLYPERALKTKVIVSVGVGGARSAIENLARCGFENYILMDGDTVSPTNIATQGVFRSEFGKKKVEALRDRILDINPEAKVICVDRFLDESMSDEDFGGYLACFKGRKSTDYLILGCTDSFPAQKRSAALAQKFGCPYLAAMMYKDGAAAELIFTYPGVTPSCPRCLLRSRYELYESGYVNDVGSEGCPIFATERMNAIKGYLALMLLLYREASGSRFNTMLERVKDRNFVWLRLDPDVKSKLGIGLFDRVFEGREGFAFMDESLWVPQHPDSPRFGEEECKMCSGSGDLRHLQMKWADTRIM